VPTAATDLRGKEEQISGSRSFSAADYHRLGRSNKGKYHCVLDVLYISPYTATMTQIRPKLEDYLHF